MARASLKMSLPIFSGDYYDKKRRNKYYTNNILTMSSMTNILQSILDYYFYEQYAQLYFYCFIYSSLQYQST